MSFTEDTETKVEEVEKKEETKPAVAEATATAKGPDITELEDGRLVINGRIYETVADIEKKVKSADEHIKTLEEENKDKDATTLKLLDRLDSLEEQLKQQRSVDELLKELKTTTEPEAAPQQEISREEMLAALKDDLKQEALQEKQEANLSAALGAAEKAYGDEFKATIAELAAKRDMKLTDVDVMARNNPALFNELFLPASEQPEVVVDTTSSTVESIPDGRVPEKKFNYMKASYKERQAYVKERMKQAMGDN
jgi:chromosome segregation ATPase